MKCRGESRARLPLASALVLLAILPLGFASSAGAQETQSQTQPPPPTSPPVIPPPSNRPGLPGTLPSTGPPYVLGPDGKPFVPPAPPAPSQIRIPGAFDPLRIPTGAPHFTLTPTLSITEQWTDNFFIAGHGRTENLRSTLSGGLDLLMNLPSTQGSLSGSMAVSHDTARDDTDFNYFPSFSGSLTHTFSPRLSVSVSDTFRRDDDPLLADPNGLQNQRRTFISNSFSVAVNWLVDVVQTQFYYRNSLFIADSDTTISHIIGANATVPIGALHSLSGGYELSFQDASGDNDASQISNRIWAALSRQLNAFTTAGVSSSFSYISGEGSDSRIANISLFAAYGTPAGLSVSGSVGYGIFDSDGATSLTHLFTATFAASYRFTRGVVSLAFFQDFRQTADEGENFGVVMTRSVNGTFTYPITPFIDGSIFAQYSRNEPVNGGGSQVSSATSVFTAGASLGWRIVTWLSLELSYYYIERRSDHSSQISSSGGSQNQRNTPNLENSTENRATLTLSARF